MCFSVQFKKLLKSVDEFKKTQQSCCSVESGALIFALSNCLMTGIGSVASVAWLMGHVFWYFILGHSNAGTLSTDLIVSGIAAGTIIIAFASLAFGFVLVKGILKKRPTFIRAYFVYGVMVVTICLATSVSLCATGTDIHDVYVVCALIIICTCVLYSAVLGIIWLTYRKYQRAMQYHHRHHWILHAL